MAQETYFIIQNGEGDTTVEEVTKEVLLKRIEEDYYGPTECIPEIPKNNNTNYWGGHGNILVIKGRIVTPTPIEIVTKYKID